MNYYSACEEYTSVIKSIDLLLQDKAPDDNKENLDGAIFTLIAAQEGCQRTLKLLLEAGADFDNPDQYEVTPLFIAAENGHIEIVELLLKAQANIDLPAHNGATPLIMAVQNGDVEAVRLLLEYGANIDLPAHNGVTPLYVAAENGHIEIVELLLEYKANVDLYDQHGITPLFMAAQEGHVAVVKLLLDNGAKVELPDQEGATPLLIAVQNGHVEVVKLLVLKGADINVAVNSNNILDSIFLFHRESLETKEAMIKALLQSNDHSLKIETAEQKEAVMKVLPENHLLVPAKAPLYNDVLDSDINNVIDANKVNVTNAFNDIKDATAMPEKGVICEILEYLEDMSPFLLSYNYASAANANEAGESSLARVYDLAIGAAAGG